MSAQVESMPRRYWLTAKGARALGHQVSPDVDDDQAVIVVSERGEVDR